MEILMRTEQDARELLGSISIDITKIRGLLTEKGFKNLTLRIDDAGKTSCYMCETIINPNGTQMTKMHNLDDRYGHDSFVYTTSIDE